MSARLVGAVVLALVLSGCGASSTHASAKRDSRLGAASTGHLALSRGWVTDSGKTAGKAAGTGTGMDMAGTSAAYFTIRNDGSAADQLVSASSSRARAVQLHRTTTGADGTSGTMSAVTVIPVPARGTAVLQPGGYHLMLLDPVRSLVAGQHVRVTLTFRSGATLAVSLPVLDREDRPES